MITTKLKHNYASAPTKRLTLKNPAPPNSALYQLQADNQLGALYYLSPIKADHSGERKFRFSL